MLEEKKTESLREVAEKAKLDRKEEVEQIQDISGENYIAIVASHSKKKYHFRPVGINQIPALFKLIKRVQELMSANPGADDVELLSANDGEIIKVISKIIHMGVKEELSEEQAAEEFSIGDFPKCLSATLDMNDFLAGMRNVFQMEKKN